MGNIVSTIHEENRKKLSEHPKPNLDRVTEYRLRDVREEPANWTRDKEKLQRRRARWEKKKKKQSSDKKQKEYDRRVDDFLTSRALVHRESGDPPWEATDLLGAGAFGVVGLFQQLNDRGEPFDQVAVKETVDTEPKPYISMVKRRGSLDDIPSEALWMDVLGRRTYNVPFLRQLIHFHGGSNMRWRFYMEYCPNGDVSSLIKIYREFNKTHDRRDEQIIPEAYIWFLFHGLARALLKMDLPKHYTWIDKDLVHDVPGSERFILHLDIKGENTLLGKSSKLDNLRHYPPAKLSDFGLAQMTSLQHPSNCRRWKGNGTEPWWPPEQYDQGHFDVKWKKPAVRPNHNWNHPYDQRHGVWAIAAIIYDVCSLGLHNQELHGILNDIYRSRDGEITSRERNMSMLKGRKLSFRKDYSDALLQLLDKCLNLAPKKRPFPSEVVDICERAMEEMGKQAEREQIAAPTVFYGINGLNELKDHVRRRQKSPPPKRYRSPPPPARRRKSIHHRRH